MACKGFEKLCEVGLYCINLDSITIYHLDVVPSGVTGGPGVVVTCEMQATVFDAW